MRELALVREGIGVNDGGPRRRRLELDIAHRTRRRVPRWSGADHPPLSAPDDREGPFYRIYREGVLEDWDGFRVEVKRSPSCSSTSSWAVHCPGQPTATMDPRSPQAILK